MLRGGQRWGNRGSRGGEQDRGSREGGRNGGGVQKEMETHRSERPRPRKN